MRYIIGYVVVFVLSIGLLSAFALAGEWKTEITPVEGVDSSPQGLIRFMKDHGEDITITGNRVDDCYGKGLWLSGYGVILRVFRKTDHPTLRPAVICQDYAGDYYIQTDDKVVVQPQN